MKKNSTEQARAQLVQMEETTRPCGRAVEIMEVEDDSRHDSAIVPWKSSSRVLLCVLPFVLVSGLAFLVLLFPRNSTWVLISNLPPRSANTGLDVSLLPSSVEMRNEPPPGASQSAGKALTDEAAEPPQVLPSTELKKEDPISNSTSSDESVGQVTTTSSKQKVRTSLDKLEVGLQRARQAIGEATNGSRQPDPDYVPNSPIYWNSKAFHRSYLEMERRFKIFMYEEGDPPLFHDGPCYLLYTTEGIFMHKMNTDKKFRTTDPEKAHVFFLPYSVTNIVKYLYVPHTYYWSIVPIIQDYVNLIAQRYPYWNRSLGADHFILSCHDWGPYTSQYVPLLAKNSIRALCNANTSEKFNPTKDASIPELIIKFGVKQRSMDGPSPSQRSTLAFFAGGNHGTVRPLLFRHWAKRDPDIEVHSYLPKGVSYYDLMKKAKFCLCPSGYEVASPRLYEAITTGCVPVLISKSFVPPFSDVLNWKMFSVIVSLEEIPNLKNILMGISDRQYLRMHKRVALVRRHFEIHTPPKRYDAFHMMVHSIWLRRLNVRINNGPEDVTD